MDDKTYKLIGADYFGNNQEDVTNPGLWWMTGFLFVVSFLGLFSLVPLRKVMILDYKLTYPSGTATAMLINSFHNNTGAELAGIQVKCLAKYLSLSFVWSCFKWFFSGIGDACGFDHFPTLGLALFKHMETRSFVLEESLKKLGVEKLGKEDVQRMQWEVLESKIENWIHFMRIAVKLLLAG